MPRPLEFALTIALAGAPLAAQNRPTAPPEPVGSTRAERPEPVTETTYREARSLTLFQACDRSADDRLDVFEFAAAFIDLANPRDPAVFRRLDTDTSGFVEWPEFDARFSLTIERAGRLRLQPVREPEDVRDPTVPPPPADPTEQIIGQFDVDHDGALSKQEFLAFVRRADLDASVVERFSQIDTDQNGTLSVPEFSPVLLAAPSVWQRIAPHEQEIRAMPAEFRAIDLNLDGAIDHRELDLGLRRIHPALSAWTGRALYDADRSRDKALGWTELAAAAAVARRRLEER